MTYNFLIEMRKRTRPFNLKPMVQIIIGLVVTNLTLVLLFVWSLRDEQIRNGWKGVLKRVKESRMTQYHSDDVQNFTKSYWNLIGDLYDCNNLGSWQQIGVEIEVFERFFDCLVPDAILESRSQNLRRIHESKYRSLIS